MQVLIRICLSHRAIQLFKRGQVKCYHELIGDEVTPNLMRGIDYVRDPRLNKGMAFTLEERQRLGVHGLLPPRFKTQEEQVKLCMQNLSRYTEDLNKFIYLMSLQDRHEKLFYRVVSENVEITMPLVYTPTVGLVCQKFGLIFRRPRGLFISIHDRGHIYDVMCNWPENHVKAIVVTDGERILGLGDLGAHGMGIPIGKLSLYTALAGIKPHNCLPITLDVGTNNQDLLDDELYIGLKQKRVTGDCYYEFIDEFMNAAVKRYGQNVLIQFEDFGNQHAFHLLDKYRNKYCTFNDDIQGTASVALAGFMAAMRLLGTKLSDHRFLFLGAGEAALGIASLCVKAMLHEGLTEKEAYERFHLTDADGLLVHGRPEGGISGLKVCFAKYHEPMKDFSQMIDKFRPSILIGAAAQPQYFTENILHKMGQYNKNPIIFALSNPTSKAECTAEQAYRATEGRAVFASGSPFDPVTINGETFYPGQGNNAYIFPGVALAVLAAGIRHIDDCVFLKAAQTLSSLVTERSLTEGRLYPPLGDVREVSVKLAVSIIDQAYENGTASTYPRPDNLESYIRSLLYDYTYTSSLHATYDWKQ